MYAHICFSKLFNFREKKFADICGGKNPRTRIKKSVISDPGTREVQLNFLSFYTIVIYYVFTTRSNKCTL